MSLLLPFPQSWQALERLPLVPQRTDGWNTQTGETTYLLVCVPEPLTLDWVATNESMFLTSAWHLLTWWTWINQREEVLWHPTKPAALRLVGCRFNPILSYSYSNYREGEHMVGLKQQWKAAAANTFWTCTAWMDLSVPILKAISHLLVWLPAGFWLDCVHRPECS